MSVPVLYTYIEIYSHFVVTSSDAPEIHTYIEISLEHLKFQAVLHGSWPRRHCNCVGSKFFVFSMTFCNKKICTSFLYPQSWISHFGLYNYITIIECNGEARRQRAKNAWNFAMD